MMNLAFDLRVLLGLACTVVMCPAQEAGGTAVSSAESWAMHRGHPGLHGVAKGSLADAFEVAWSFETGDSILSSPVVVDGVVFFGSTDLKVYAVDLATGAKKWEFATEDMVEAPPLVLDGTVFIGSSDFFLYALDATTGELRWKFETGDKILGGANYVRSGERTVIVVGSYDSKLYGFDSKSGEKLWEYQTDNYINGTPGIAGDKVVFGGCDATLHIVDAATGKGVDKIPLGDECHVPGSVAAKDGKVYFGHYGNEMVCIDLESGEADWAYPNQRHPFFSSPAIGADRLVFGCRDKKLHCVAKDTGKPLWTFRTRRKVDGSPVICGDKVVFGSGDGKVYVLNLADGKEVWRYDVGRPVFSSPAVVGGWFVVGAGDGRVYAFRPKKESP